MMSTGWLYYKIFQSVETIFSYFRFDTTVLFNHYLWAGPLQLIIMTAILCYKIGPSALVGAVLLVLFVPLQSKNINVIEVSHYHNNKFCSMGGKAVWKTEGRDCWENRQENQTDE